MSTLEKRLEPFLGYLELKMFKEALAELDALPPEFQGHELVGLGRLDILLGRHRWKEAVVLGESLCVQFSQFDTFFIHTAFAMHELGRTVEARETLLKGPPSLHRQAVYFYNLACYQSRLGELEEARKLLGRCFILDEDFRDDAQEDPDLHSLRQSALWSGL